MYILYVFNMHMQAIFNISWILFILTYKFISFVKIFLMIIKF